MLKGLLRELFQLRSSFDETILERDLSLKNLIPYDLILLGHLSDVFKGKVVYLGEPKPHLFLDAPDNIGECLQPLLQTLHDAPLAVELAPLLKVKPLHEHRELLLEPLPYLVLAPNAHADLVVDLTLEALDLDLHEGELRLITIRLYPINRLFLVLVANDERKLIFPCLFEATKKIIPMHNDLLLKFRYHCLLIYHHLLSTTSLLYKLGTQLPHFSLHFYLLKRHRLLVTTAHCDMTATAAEHPISGGVLEVVLVANDHIDLKFMFIGARLHYLVPLVELLKLRHHELSHHSDLVAGHRRLRPTRLILLCPPHLQPLHLSLQMLRHFLENLSETTLRPGLKVE